MFSPRASRSTASLRSSSARILAFPVRVSSLLVEEQDAAGQLVRRQPTPQEVAHAVLVDGAAGLGHGAHHHDLAQGGVGHADRQRAVQAGMAQELVVDLDGRDVGAPRLDEVRGAPHPVQLPLVVDEPGVAGGEEAVGVEDLLGGDLQVALHEGGPLDPDLPGHAGRLVLAGRRVDDAHDVAGEDHPLVALALRRRGCRRAWS